MSASRSCAVRLSPGVESLAIARGAAFAGRARARTVVIMERRIDSGSIMGLIMGLKMRYWMWCLMVLCYSGREDAVEALYIHRSLAVAPHSVSIHINLEPRCVFQIVVGFELFTAHTVFPGNLMYARSRFHSLALSGR